MDVGRQRRKRRENLGGRIRKGEEKKRKGREVKAEQNSNDGPEIVGPDFQAIIRQATIAQISNKDSISLFVSLKIVSSNKKKKKLFLFIISIIMQIFIHSHDYLFTIDYENFN